MLPQDWIDSHVHLWTPDTKWYPFAIGTDAAAVAPKDFSPEVLLRHARPSGVGRAVLVQTILYGTDNSYMLDAIERFPTVFRMAAMVDRHSERLADEMSDLRERGVTGFRIIAPPDGADGWLDDAGYNEMFKIAAKTRQAICPLTQPEGLPEIDRMCGLYPDTAVVIDHMARIGEQGSVDDGDVRMLCGLARHPNVYVKASRFHSLGVNGGEIMYRQGGSRAEMWRLKSVPPVAFNQERPNLTEGGLDVQGGYLPPCSQGLFRRRDERPRGGPSVRATPGHGAQDARVLRAPRVSTATTGSQTEARSI